jgi:hypothetical protein
LCTRGIGLLTRHVRGIGVRSDQLEHFPEPFFGDLRP